MRHTQCFRTSGCRKLTLFFGILCQINISEGKIETLGLQLAWYGSVSNVFDIGKDISIRDFPWNKGTAMVICYFMCQ